MLLALDPGMNSPGIAIFDNSGLMHAQSVSIPESFAEFNDGTRWLYVAQQIVHEASKYLGAWRLDVIFERPQWYAAAKSKGDPNQLAGVAGVAACVTGILSARHLLQVFSPKPAEWVGQLPKTCKTCGANKKKCSACGGSAWNTPRGRRIRSRLSDAEFAHCPDQNDAIDAVGLGLWRVGRFMPHSVLSNGCDGR